MLTWLKIENFKAFGRPQSFPLRPLTLIFGSNSSGKSSIIQALLLAKQTINSDGDSRASLVPRGTDVDVGGYSEFVYRHDQARNVRFAFQSSRDTAPIRYSLGMNRGKEIKPKDLAWFKQCAAFVEYTLKSNRAIQLTRFGLERTADEERVLSVQVGEPESAEDSRLRGLIETDLLNPHPELRHWFVGRALRSLPSDSIDVEILADKIRELERKCTVRRNVERFDWVFDAFDDALQKGMLIARAAGRQAETLIPGDEGKTLWDTLQLEKVVRSESENAAEKLAAYGDRQLFEDIAKCPPTFTVGLPWPSLFVGRAELLERHEEVARDLLRACDRVFGAVREDLQDIHHIGPLRDFPQRFYTFGGAKPDSIGSTGQRLPDLLYVDRNLLGLVNNWLAKFGVSYTIDLHEIEDPIAFGMFALRVIDSNLGIETSSRDVGIGVSQVLPIILQTVITRNGILCIEQPELHLHPKLQAELGSLFAESIAGQAANQMIVETHSEHLILRIQRLIRTGRLSPDQVAVLHVRPAEEGAIVKEMRLDTDGEFIDSWPDGFFEEGFLERFSD